MKKTIAVILILSLLLALSSCRLNMKITYWNGMSKQETEELILGELEEKYGEEFTILKLYVNSTGYIGTAGYLSGICAPKSDENLVFEIERWKNSEIEDTYIQSIVRREMIKQIDNVLSEHCEKYAVEIEVKGLSPKYDSGIRSAEDVSIQTYTEALPEENSTSIMIILSESLINTENDYEIVNLILGFTKNYYYTKAFIDCYYVPLDIMEQCIEATRDDLADLTDLVFIVSGRYPKDDFVYTGIDQCLTLVGTDRYDLREVKYYE